MASPITWKNVGSTVGTSGIGGLMDGASESMNKASEGVEDIFKTIKDRDKRNWDQGKINNTNTAMNTLYGAQTPEELAAMKERGDFQAMMQQYGAQVDQKALRNALDGRGEVLQNRLEGRQEYQDGQHNRGLRGDLQEILAQAANGDRAAIEQAAQLGYRDDGEMLGDVTDAVEGGIDLGIREDQNARGWVRNQIAQTSADQRTELFNRKTEKLDEAENKADANEWATSQMDALTASVANGEVTDPMELNSMIETLERTIASNEHLTEADTQSLMGNFTKTLSEAGGTTPVMGAVVSQVQEQNERDLGLTDDPIYQAYKSSADAGPGETTVSTLNNFVNENGDLFGQQDNDDRNQTVQEAYRLANVGVDHKFRNAEGAEETVNVRFDQPMLELMAMGVEGNSGLNPFTWSLENSIEENAREFLEANPEVAETAKKMQELKSRNELAMEGGVEASNPLADLYNRLR